MHLNGGFVGWKLTLSPGPHLTTFYFMNATELPSLVHEAIQRFCADGDELAATGNYEDAIGIYNRAWEIVPEPKDQWQASTWILAAIADAAFLAGYKTSAKEALEYAMICPDAVGNPFLHLRLGQVLLDMGEHDRAADELMRAYMGAGAELFATEDQRYLAYLRTRATLD
jgi:tetratricopeptide (TPR) repeat protein